MNLPEIIHMVLLKEIEGGFELQDLGGGIPSEEMMDYAAEVRSTLEGWDLIFVTEKKADLEKAKNAIIRGESAAKAMGCLLIIDIRLHEA